LVIVVPNFGEILLLQLLLVTVDMLELYFFGLLLVQLDPTLPLLFFGI
jgi:hypothetical protein